MGKAEDRGPCSALSPWPCYPADGEREPPSTWSSQRFRRPGRLGKCCLFTCVLSRVLLCDPTDCSPPGFSVQGVARKNTGVGCHFLQMRTKVTWNLEETSALEENYLRTSWQVSAASAGLMAVRRAWILFNGEGLLEPRPPGDCVCVLVSLRKRSPKREFLGVEGEFLILFFGEKGPGVDHMQALGSDPHAKPPKGPRARRAGLQRCLGSASSGVPRIARRALRSLELPAACGRGRGWGRARNSTYSGFAHLRVPSEQLVLGRPENFRLFPVNPLYPIPSIPSTLLRGETCFTSLSNVGCPAASLVLGWAPRPQRFAAALF